MEPHSLEYMQNVVWQHLLLQNLNVWFSINGAVTHHATCTEAITDQLCADNKLDGPSPL